MFKVLKDLEFYFFRLLSIERRYVKYFFFFLFSFFFWFLTMLSKNHEAKLIIPVEYSNLPMELIISDTLTSNIEVTVIAPGFKIVTLYITNFQRLTLDVLSSNSKKTSFGKEIFWLMHAKRKQILDILGSSVEIIFISPERVSIECRDKQEAT